MPEREAAAEEVGRAFVERSRRYLTHDYLPRIEGAVARLADGDLWWRPNPACNSVGNLLLHLAGNLRQWVVSGVGGAPDRRHRQAEFDAVDGPPAAALLVELHRTVWDADAALAALRPGALLERRRIQGRDVTVLEAIYHAVEHFGMHTGQIILVAKQRSAADLGFYHVVDGIATALWPVPPGAGER